MARKPTIIEVYRRGLPGDGATPGEIASIRQDVDILSPSRAHAVVGNDQGAPTPVRIAKTPEMYGAVGDYDPVTNTGTDDTAAIQAWINDLGGGEVGTLPPGKFFLCTSTITLQKWTHIDGGGRTSGLFFRPTDPAADGLRLVTDTYATEDDIFYGALRNFGLYARATSGAALKATYLQKVVIDLTFAGPWDTLLDVTSGEPTGTGSGGGIETSTIALWHDAGPIAGTTYQPARPLRGVYNRGWSNATDYYLNLRRLRGTAIELRGTYGGANMDTRIHGVLQMIAYSPDPAAPAVIVERSAGVDISELYHETNGGGIDLINWAMGRVNNVGGPLTLTSCRDTTISNVLPGPVTIDAACERVVVGAGVYDVSNHSPSTVFTTFTKRNLGSQSHSVAGAGIEPVNVFPNGDMRRWIAGAASRHIWGSSSSKTYIGTRCGVGMADTTRTSGSPWCAKIEIYPGLGYTYEVNLFPAGALSGMLGMPLYVAFKYKMVSGRLYLQGSSPPTNVQHQIHVNGNDPGIPCENGFRRYVRTFVVTQVFIDNGFTVRFHVPDYAGTPSVAYLSEVMAGFGAVAPPVYEPPTFFSQPLLRMEGSKLVLEAEATPTGGDPVSGQPWQRGDRVLFSSPGAGGHVGRVCTTAGSPGTWKLYGAIEG